MEIATYYVTLQPTHDKGRNADGMHHIAFVDDPAIEEVGIYLQKHDPRMVADEQTKSKILEYLHGCGQEVPANWREVTDEEYLAAKEIELTTDPTSRESFNDFPNPKGGGQWLVRYKYFTPDGNPVIETTRDFCREIIALNRIYTEEEIQNGLSNPEFGNYSIFDYKGSYGCRHVWKRQIYYEDYEDNEVRKVGFVPRVVSRLDDSDATTLNAFLSKDEKMQVCAPLLIPDKDVYRNDEIGKYNMRFSAQTISELRTLAASKGVLERKDLFKDTHEGGTAPSYILKEWITENENDPAYTEYGFDVRRVPIGSWMVLSQITDKEFWNKEIKGNKKYAYSIEALINLTIIKMQKMENEKIVLPDGEHLINGTIYVVEGGQVVSTKEVTEQQEEVIEEVAEAAAEEAPVEELAAVEAAPAVEALEEAPAHVEDDRISKLESQLSEMVTEVATLRALIEKPAVEETVDVQMAKVPLWKSLAALRGKN
jgi:rRNA maturation endonuclease Nob1